MWTPSDALRAPVGDFPPPYASSWWDDPYGLWVWVKPEKKWKDELRLRWIEPKLDWYWRIIESGYWMLPETVEEERVLWVIAMITKLVDEKLTFEIKGYKQEVDPEVNL